MLNSCLVTTEATELENNEPKPLCQLLGQTGGPDNKGMGYSNHHSLCEWDLGGEKIEEQMEVTGPSFTILADAPIISWGPGPSSS